MSHLRRKPRQSQIDSSKDWLAKAFIELLGKRGDKEITISEIAMKAGVSRQTLYRHFSSKEEILDWYLEDKFRVFIENCLTEGPLNQVHKANIKLVFSFCYNEILFIKTLILLKKEILLLDKIDNFTNRLEPILFPDSKEQNLFYNKKAFSGALFQLIISWISNDAVDDPDIFIKIIERYLG